MIGRWLCWYCDDAVDDDDEPAQGTYTTAAAAKAHAAAAANTSANKRACIHVRDRTQAARTSTGCG